MVFHCFYLSSFLILNVSFVQILLMDLGNFFMFLILLKGTSCLLKNNTNGKMNREIIIFIIEKHPPIQCVNFFHHRETYFLCLLFLIAIQEAKSYTFGYHIHSSCFLALLSLKDYFSTSKLLPRT